MLASIEVIAALPASSSCAIDTEAVSIAKTTSPASGCQVAASTADPSGSMNVDSEEFCASRMSWNSVAWLSSARTACVMLLTLVRVQVDVDDVDVDDIDVDDVDIDVLDVCEVDVAVDTVDEEAEVLDVEAEVLVNELVVVVIVVVEGAGGAHPTVLGV